MNKTGFSWVAVFTTVGLIIATMVIVLSQAKVPEPTAQNTYQVTAQVANISEGPGYDVRFVLEDDTKLYYINRGLERGLSLEGLRRTLLGKTVTLDAHDMPWSPLDPQNNVIPVARVSFADEVIFSAFE